MPPEDEEAARRLFTRLVRVPAGSPAPTRRTEPRIELGAEEWRVAQRLAGTRLLVTCRRADRPRSRLACVEPAPRTSRIPPTPHDDPAPVTSPWCRWPSSSKAPRAASRAPPMAAPVAISVVTRVSRPRQAPSAASTTDLASSWTRRRWSGPRKDSA
ncbi:hypothetical protein [Streptomyces poonensis]|uniref:hypothetical protein n=1 Tax=Streptomyces poonensis TaxID=68255 RepID=UPI003571442C